MNRHFRVGQVRCGSSASSRPFISGITTSVTRRSMAPSCLLASSKVEPGVLPPFGKGRTKCRRYRVVAPLSQRGGGGDFHERCIIMNANAYDHASIKRQRPPSPVTPASVPRGSPPAGVNGLDPAPRISPVPVQVASSPSAPPSQIAARRGAPAYFAPRHAGSAMVKRVPFPKSLFTWMVPLCRSTMP